MEVIKDKPAEPFTDTSFENEMTLIKYPSKIYQLNRNGNPTICPHKPPAILERVVNPGGGIALAGNQNEPRIERMEQPKPCVSNCPLFHLDQKADRTFVDLSCGSSHSHHVIKEIIAVNLPTKK